MAWNSPITWAANTILTAAQMNAQVRDNMLQTAPGIATTSGRVIVTTGTNSIAQRQVSQNFIATSETVTSTSYTDLATVGPSLTLTTGTVALVFLTSEFDNDTALAETHMGFAVTNASAVAASDIRAIYMSGTTAVRFGGTVLVSLTAGVNIFTAKYRVSAGTGTLSNRGMAIIAL